MMSDKRLRANRANAARSTGPRTANGKGALRFNARRHGLAAALRLDPGEEEEVDRLTRAIMGEEVGHDLWALAHRVAEAEIMWRRVVRARMMLPQIPDRLTRFKWTLTLSKRLFSLIVSRWARRGGILKDPTYERYFKMLEEAGYDDDLPWSMWVPLKKKKNDFEGKALNRYERRAISRRKSAIRAFDALRAQNKSSASADADRLNRRAGVTEAVQFGD
jgi:hypothetical protein